MSTPPKLPTLSREPCPGRRLRPWLAPAATFRCRNALATLVLTLTLALPPRTAAAQAGPPGSDDPVALVVRVQGEVGVERNGASAPATAGQRLLAGDRLVPEPSARALLVVRSGAQQVVDEPTTLAAPSAAEPADLFARAVATLAQAATLDATLGGRQGMIRPIPGRTALLDPANGLTVLPRRPSFRWTATPDARYELMLRRVGGGRPQIFDVGADTTWTLPPGTPELVPGAMYAWTVFVGGRDGGRPLPQQEFRVVSVEESHALDALMATIRSFGLDPSGDGRVLAAIVFRQLELFYAARDALEALQQDEAAVSPDLHRLHGEVLAELGDAEGARRAFDRAAGSPR